MSCLVFSSAWAEKKLPHIILISIDTLGSDHLAVYGNPHVPTPAIDAFANESIVFKNSLSAAAYTLPSHYSIFTGTYPQTHNVEMCSPFESRGILSQKILTLPQYLEGLGYKSFWMGVLVDNQLDLWKGLGRSWYEKTPFNFQHIDMGLRKKMLQDVLEKAVKQPSFLFFHTYAVHSPYFPASPRDKNSQNFLKKIKNKNKIEMDLGEDFVDEMNPNNAQDKKIAHSLYDDGIGDLDNKFADLINELKRVGIYENAIIILTSDHGEAFGEHGYFKHLYPYAQELRVPLIIKMPGISAKQVKELVLSVDIVPTLLEYLGLKKGDIVDGQSLMPLIENKPWIRKSNFYYARGCSSDAIYDQEWKLITQSDGKNELYKTKDDKNDSQDLSDKYPEIVSRMQAELEAFKASRIKYFTKPDLSANQRRLYWLIPSGLRADPGLFNLFKWAQEGKLPNIKKMMRDGMYGFSKPSFPFYSNTNFESLLTGMHPALHKASSENLSIWNYIDSNRKSFFLLSVPGPLSSSIKATKVLSLNGSKETETYNMVIDSREADALKQQLKNNFDGKKIANFEVHGTNIKVELNSNFKTNLNKSIHFSMGSSKFNLKQGEWSDWLLVNLKIRGEVLPSKARINLIKLWSDGNFRIRVLFDNLNKFATEPAWFADVMSDAVGPMIDQLDNSSPQLIYEPEDKLTAKDELQLSLKWHADAANFINMRYKPDVFIQSTGTPRQLLESRWWLKDLSTFNKQANSKKEKIALKDILLMYKGIDQILGRVMADSTGDKIIVLSSDQGVCSLKRLVHLNNLFAKKGWLKFKFNTATNKNEIDLENTKVIYNGGVNIFVNPDGIKASWQKGVGPAYENLLQKVTTELKNLKDRNDLAPFANIQKLDEASKTYNLPIDRNGNLIIEPNTGFLADVSIDDSGKIFSDSIKAGYSAGLDPEKNECLWTPFLVWGPGVKKGFKLEKPISHTDQLPTILHLMDIKKPSNLPGRVLSEALE